METELNITPPCPFHLFSSLCHLSHLTLSHFLTPLHLSLFPLSHSLLAFLPFYSVAIGVGFYGNSEANDGMYQLTSSLLTANYTLASIDLLVRVYCKSTASKRC